MLLRVVGRRPFCLRFVVLLFLVVGGDGVTSDGPVSKVGEGLTRGGTGGPCVKRTGVVGELLGFLGANKRWWLIPMVAVLLLFGLLVIFGSASGLAPFIYTLF